MNKKIRRKGDVINTKRYVYWQDENMWLGYFEDFPAYMTQGESLSELKENLKDIYLELTGGKIPCVRKIDELEVA
jgi:predicted RNase H-like HicB family nuclease